MKINIQTIQKKIFTINKITKITKAMKIIAAINFKKNYSKINNSLFFQNIAQDIFAKLYFLSLNYKYVKKLPKIEKKNPAKKVLWIVFGSDLGLCGSFNTKIFEKVQKNISSNDSLIIVGRKIFNYFINRSFTILQNYLILNFHLTNIDKITDFLINSKDFKEIKVVYTEYHGNFKSKVILKKLLPFEIKNLPDKEEILSHFILEKSPSSIYENTLFLYLKSSLLDLYWHSRTCEEKIRQIAMEGASENSKEIIHELKLKYNQFRQEKITKEILLVSQES